MSFSFDTKISIINSEELASCCVLSELASYLYGKSSILFEGNGKFSINIVVDYEELASRVFRLLKNFDTNAQMKQIENPNFGGRHKYSINIGSAYSSNLLIALKMVDYDGNIVSLNPQYYPQKSCDKKAFLKAAFLSCGSLQNPKSAYHLEIVNNSELYLRTIIKICKSFDINFKQNIKRQVHRIYLKKSDEISRFLAVIAADSSVLEIENNIIEKQVLNRINRAMNCDTANINKILKASKKQIEVMKKLIKAGKLDDKLLEIAKIRIKNPELSMEDIGKMTNPPISKSGVNHRIRKIMNMER